METKEEGIVTDPRTLLMQPVDQPLYGAAARSVAEALRPPVDQPLYGLAARRVAEALVVRPRPRSMA